MRMNWFGEASFGLVKVKQEFGEDEIFGVRQIGNGG